MIFKPRVAGRRHGVAVSRPLEASQRGGVPRSRSAVNWCGPGTHRAFAADSSARRPTSARSSSMKRAQSARRSSVTNSPGISGARAVGVSGCSLGPGITPHFPVETVDNSDRVCNRRRLGASGYSSGHVVGDSTRSSAALNPPNVGMSNTIRAKSVNLLRGDWMRSD
jgi:hypothetical protein